MEASETKVFEIKRGMVFFLEEPGKSQTIPYDSWYAPKKCRPYIVLSHDKINSSANHTIQVAPIFTRELNVVKPWDVPFKGVNNRNQAVNCSVIMSIPKELCNEKTYNPEITQFTRYNKNLFEGISKAIIEQFCISKDIVSAETERIRSMYPVTNNPIPVQQTLTPVVPNITLNISLNGIPVDPQTVTVTQEASGIVRSKDVSEETCDKTKNVTKSEEQEDTTENNTCSDDYTFIENTSASETDIVDTQDLDEYILNNYVQFGGKMKSSEIATLFNVHATAIPNRCRKWKYNIQTDSGKKRFLRFIEKYSKKFTTYKISKITGISYMTVLKYINQVNGEVELKQGKSKEIVKTK